MEVPAEDSGRASVDVACLLTMPNLAEASAPFGDTSHWRY